VLVGMMCGVSLAALDQMVLATAVGTIAGELGNIGQAPWIFTANLLTSASAMPIWGKLGDLYGRRRVFRIAITLFVVASLLAAQSRTMPELLVCRALQGLSGGALLTVPYAILGDIVPPRERPAYLAYISVVWTTAGFLGPPLGGLLVDGPGWRWMFYLNVPAAMVAFFLIGWGYRLPVQRIEHRIDVLGAALLMGTVGSFILYTSWAGEALGWGSPAALAFLGASGLLGLAFVRQERRAAEPILALHLLGQRAVWPPLVANFVFGLANMAIAIFVPLFSIAVLGTNAVAAGLTLAPLTAGILLAGIVMGRRAARTGRFRRYTMGGFLVYAVGVTGLALAGPGTTRLAFGACTLALGFGGGTIGAMVVSSLQSAVDARYIGVASSLPGFSRTIAQTIGTSALGTFFAVRLGVHVERAVAPYAASAHDAQALIDAPGAIRDLSEPLRGVLVEAYRASFSESFVLMAAIILSALVAARFMIDPDERR